MTIELESGPPPEWMIALENKKRNHKLAHEIGAGAPCLKCNNECSGLDLHFWRKICRNCKCKKELHDVKEENNFEQFEILFGENLRGSERIKKISLNLKCKLDDIFANRDSAAKENSVSKSENDLTFDWIPADVPANLASEYLQQLPLDKLPITGSAGAMLRRQQLQKQIPLHDFKVKDCHDLTDEETLAFTEYVDNLKSNAVGKGLITKILPSPTDNDHVKTSKQPAFLNNLNSTPKPFKSFSDRDGDAAALPSPPPPSELHFPAAELKTPSAFVPYRKLNVRLTPTRNLNESYDAGLPLTTQPFIYDKLQPISSPVDHLTAQYADKLTVADKNSMNLDTVNNNNNNSNSSSADNINNNNGGDVASPVEHLTPSEIIRRFNAGRASSSTPSQAREAAVKHEIVRTPNTYCERSRTYAANDGVRDAYASPLTRDAHADVVAAAAAAKKVDARYLKLGHPEQFVALSSYVPNRPQLSNTLTTATASPGASAAAATLTTLEHDRNQNPRVRFGAIPTIGGGDGGVGGEDDVVAVDPHHQVTPFRNAALHPDSYCVAGDDGDGDVDCHQCKRMVHPGQVVVVAERAGHEVIWHPQCFVCVICEELLVDLVYFFHRGEVYCGRHYAEVLKIPRCFACDELIFLKKYTVAEGQTFHIKHFCCFECDIPLAEKSYVSKDDNPVCLPCYELKYCKTCNCCSETIKAGASRVSWKELSWHATASCFKCVQCLKSLLGGKFMVRSDKPLCSKDCIIQFELTAGQE